MATATPLLDPDRPFNEGLMFIIGIGTVWVFVGIALFWVLDFPLTFEGAGQSLALTLIPVAVTIGGHEVAHLFVADEYCRYTDTDFAALVSTTTLTLASIIGATLLVLLDVFGVVSLPKWLLLFGVVSPGAVLIPRVAFSKRPLCRDETALAGPLYNFVVGVGLFWWMGSIPIPTPDMAFTTFVLSTTAILSLGLAFLNSLPIGPLDGRKVVQAREPVTLILWAVVVLGSGWILFGAI